MNLFTLLSVFASGALLSAVLLYGLLRSGLAGRLALDQPNARSLHSVPTPRCGGLGPILVALIALCAYLPQSVILLVGIGLLAAVSWLDDRRGLPIAIRFGTHALVAVLLVESMDKMPALIVLASVIAIIWGINLFNFMDGANGMSAAMLVTGFSTYALALYAMDAQNAVLSAALAGGGLGFWLFNRSPAQLFLGDVGSIPSGFLMAAIGLVGWRNGIWPVWFPWLVFSPFIADATFTLLRRALRKEAVWRAHREHFYQRMIQSGFSHTKTTALWFALMLIACLLALWLRHQSAASVWTCLLSYAALLTACALWIEHRYNKVKLEN